MTDTPPTPEPSTPPAGVSGSPELYALWQEVERAAGHYYHSAQQLGIDARTKQLVLERCAPFFRGPRTLELGYVDGSWTDAILTAGSQVDIVEGAHDHVEHARQRYRGNGTVRVFHQLFQQFEPPEQYDTIVAGDMIRYLDDPVSFLNRMRQALAPGGRLVATVPNSRSMHRRVGALMNLEPSPVAANQRDREVGNRRSYDRYEFRQLLQDSGFAVERLHGCFLKPLSSPQIEHWSDDLLRAFLLLGDEMEDYCWFIYAVCRNGTEDEARRS